MREQSFESAGPSAGVRSGGAGRGEMIAGQDGATPATDPGSGPGASVPGRLWSRDFALLWQGQLVSGLGDIVYEIALGFWVLAATGSTALMGSLMAIAVLPRVVIGPFAGVWVDRLDRKRILIGMDLLRGAAVIAVATAAFSGRLEVWMVFAAGTVIGIGGAFFTPALGSVVPDIVPSGRLVQANSAMALVSTGAGVIGNSAGGFLFAAIGASRLFLFNGLSYLVSALALFAVRIPAHRSPAVPPPFWSDLRAGMSFVWKISGLRALFLCAMVLNFFAVMGITLFLPLFQRTEGWGPARYGVTMALLTGGLFLGFALSSIVHIPPARRFRVFQACGVGMMLMLIPFPLVESHVARLVLVFAAGGATAVLNSLIPATRQLSVPPEMRGKTFALLGSVSQGLMPIAMALAGVLAEFLPIRVVIAGSFGFALICFLPLFVVQSFRRFVNFDPEHQGLEDLRL